MADGNETAALRCIRDHMAATVRLMDQLIERMSWEDESPMTPEQIDLAFKKLHKVTNGR